MFQMQVFDGKATIMALLGRLDTTSAPALESEGVELVAKGCRTLILDLTGLEYLSSAGLRAVLGIAKKITPLGGKVILCGATGLVAHVFFDIRLCRPYSHRQNARRGNHCLIGLPCP